VAGAFFKASTDIVPEASSWTAITTATTAYLALTPSGTAGSQILTAAWVSSGSIIWSDSKQGWYNSGETARLVISAYKGGTSQYLNKFILEPLNTVLYSTVPSIYKGFQGIEERIISGSGNWVVPTGVYRIRVKCVGGGGGGGGSYNAGGGGGGGVDICGLPWNTILVLPGQIISYAVGAGGTAGIASYDPGSGIIGGTGGTGGTTSFGSLSMLGSSGGEGSTANSANGGAGVNGGYGIPGESRMAINVTPRFRGGNGGGNGGIGGYGAAGGDGGFGGGGGGGGYDGSSTGAGGTGGSGIIIIEY
jgi:hypothetical protein